MRIVLDRRFWGPPKVRIAGGEDRTAGYSDLKEARKLIDQRIAEIERMRKTTLCCPICGHRVDFEDGYERVFDIVLRHSMVRVHCPCCQIEGPPYYNEVELREDYPNWCSRITRVSARGVKE